MPLLAKISAEFDKRALADAAAGELLKRGLVQELPSVVEQAGEADPFRLRISTERYREAEDLLRSMGAAGWETEIDDGAPALAGGLPRGLIQAPEADALEQATSVIGAPEPARAARLEPDADVLEQALTAYPDQAPPERSAARRQAVSEADEIEQDLPAYVDTGEERDF